MASKLYSAAKELETVWQQIWRELRKKKGARAEKLRSQLNAGYYDIQKGLAEFDSLDEK